MAKSARSSTSNDPRPAQVRRGKARNQKTVKEQRNYLNRVLSDHKREWTIYYLMQLIIRMNVKNPLDKDDEQLVRQESMSEATEMFRGQQKSKYDKIKQLRNPFHQELADINKEVKKFYMSMQQKQLSQIKTWNLTKIFKTKKSFAFLDVHQQPDSNSEINQQHELQNDSFAEILGHPYRPSSLSQSYSHMSNEAIFFIIGIIIGIFIGFSIAHQPENPLSSNLSRCPSQRPFNQDQLLNLQTIYQQVQQVTDMMAAHKAYQLNQSSRLSVESLTNKVLVIDGAHTGIS